MKKKSFKYMAHNYITAFLITQCVVTLIALPLTTSWGLPLSLASFVGNFIFSPILGLFLVLSSLVFFTTLLGIPDGMLCRALELLYRFWEWLLQYGSKTWLIGFAQPPAWFLVGMLTGTYFVISRPLIINRFSRLAIIATALTCNILCLWIYTWYKTPKIMQTEQITNNRGSLIILHHPDKTLSLIDYGYFKGALAADKMINYELRPYFLKKYGTLAIRSFQFQKASSSNFQAAQGLSLITNLQKIKAPYFAHNLTKPGWRSYFSLKRTLEQLNIPCKRFSPNGKFIKWKKKKKISPRKITFLIKSKAYSSKSF